MNVCFLPIPLGRQVRFTTAQQGGSGGKKCKKQTCGDWGEGKEDHQVSKQVFLRHPVEVLEEAVVEQAFVCCLWRGTTVEQIHTMEPPRRSRGMCPEGNAARESPTGGGSPDGIYGLWNTFAGAGNMWGGGSTREGMSWAGHNPPFLILLHHSVGREWRNEVEAGKKGPELGRKTVQA